MKIKLICEVPEYQSNCNSHTWIEIIFGDVMYMYNFKDYRCIICNSYAFLDDENNVYSLQDDEFKMIGMFTCNEIIMQNVML